MWWKGDGSLSVEIPFYNEEAVRVSIDTPTSRYEIQWWGEVSDGGWKNKEG